MKIFRHLNIEESNLRLAFDSLPKRDRRRVLLIAAFNVGVGIFDLIALSIIGVIGSVAIKGINSAPGNSLELGILSSTPIMKYEFQVQVALLSILVSILLIARTIISMVLGRKILFFLSAKSAMLSSDLISRLLRQSIQTLNSTSTQQNLYAVTAGVQRIMVGVLGVALNLFADLTLLVFIGLGLFLLDPLLAISTTSVFSTIAIILYFFMGKRASRLGEESTELNIESNRKILEVLSSFREAVVKNRQDFYARKIGNTRFSVANLEAELAFIPLFSKYILEISVVLGALIVSAIQFIYKDAINAFSSLALFIVAGSRLAPAVLRIQQGFLGFRTSSASAILTCKFMRTLPRHEVTIQNDDVFPFPRVDEIEPRILLNNVSFTYKDNAQPTIRKLSLDVAPGKSVALVGPSGAGKSTLVDLILGILEPTSGEIYVSGVHPKQALKTWQGSIAYVPQDVMLIDGTIRENICLGYEVTGVNNENIDWAIKTSSLTELIDGLPLGLETPVGELGNKVSGGQRQRIGIARALVTRPMILVLDESTSSLDAKAEESIIHSLKSLKGKMTLIMIAHRLSSVRESDDVIYLDRGRIIASGTFEYVRDAVPDFDAQSKIMGL